MSCNRPGAMGSPANLDNVAHIVRRLEETGYLPEFVRVYPQYAVGVERARAHVIQGARGYYGDIGNRQQQFHVGSAQIPSSTSIRFFVNLLAQLLEEQCPNRGDVTCEDRCLAAIQFAISECLKIVRHNRSCPGCDSCDTPSNRQAQIVTYGKHMGNPAPNAITAGPLPPQLTQKLESIPEPRPCCQSKYVQIGKDSCGLNRTKNSGKHLDKSCDFPTPVAGEYSDGVGGFKIKCFPAPTNESGAGMVDGMGGRKAKSIDD